MASKYQDVQWIVQQNLTSKEDFKGLMDACEKLGISFHPVTIVPFSSELPEFDRKRHSIPYGSTTFNALVSQDIVLSKGLFFNEATFSMQNYFDSLGEYMLNYCSRICTLDELMNSSIENDKLVFIRPNDDGKSFAGDIVRFGEIKEWYNELSSVANTNLSLNTKIVVSEPYNIQTEWRLWIVEKKAVAASKYREFFRLKKEEGCPAEVVLIISLGLTHLFR